MKMKKLVILFTLLAILVIALSTASFCFAEDEIVETDETPTTEEIVVDEPIIEASADNNALVWVKETWEKTKSYAMGIVSGTLFSSIVGAIVVVVVKRMTNKAMDKVEQNTNTTTIAEKVSQKFNERISNVALDVNIKPIVMSELKAIYEEIMEELMKEIKKQDQKNLALIKCFEGIAGYYKCSTAIGDEEKAFMMECIKEAYDLYADTTTNVKATIEVVAEAPKGSQTKKVVENY